MIDRRHPRDPTAEGVPDDDRGPTALVADDGRNVTGQIVKRQPQHRSAALTGAARLRPQDAESGFGYGLGEAIEILRPAATRRQHHDKRAASLSNDLNPNVVIDNDFARRLGPCSGCAPYHRNNNRNRKDAAPPFEKSAQSEGLTQS
jgi:hypothetical protein